MRDPFKLDCWHNYIVRLSHLLSVRDMVNAIGMDKTLWSIPSQVAFAAASPLRPHASKHYVHMSNGFRPSKETTTSFAQPRRTDGAWCAISAVARTSADLFASRTIRPAGGRDCEMRGDPSPVVVAHWKRFLARGLQNEFILLSFHYFACPLL